MKGPLKYVIQNLIEEQMVLKEQMDECDFELKHYVYYDGGWTEEEHYSYWMKEKVDTFSEIRKIKNFIKRITSA